MSVNSGIVGEQGVAADLACQILQYFALDPEAKRPRTYTDCESMNAFLRSTNVDDWGLLSRVVATLEREALLTLFPNQPQHGLQNAHFVAAWSQETLLAEIEFGRIEALFGGLPAVRSWNMRAVLPIVGINAHGDPAIGSCLLLSSRVVLTAAHCVEDVSQPKISVGDQEIRVTDWRRPADKSRDIAFAELAEECELPIVSVRYRPAYCPERVILLGYPAVPLVQTTMTTSIGQVAGIVDDYLAKSTVNLVDVSSAGGNSGGPLFGSDGYLLGIASRKPETGARRADLDKLERDAAESAPDAKSRESEPAERSPFLIVEPLDICTHVDVTQLDTAQWRKVDAH